MVAVCNFRSSAFSRETLVQRCPEVMAGLAALSADLRIEALTDSRALHATLFNGLAPAAFPDAAGVWRGTSGSSIETAPRAVFLACRLPGLKYRDICLPADEVPAAMVEFENEVLHLWQDRPGQDDAWRDAAFQALAGLTARFFAIHPFMDGNGQVWRLMLPFLAARLGLETRSEWTVHQRPYGPEFSLALQWHADHPSLLADQLRRWFRPDTAP